MDVGTGADGHPDTVDVEAFRFRLAGGYASVPGRPGAIGEPFKLLDDL